MDIEKNLGETIAEVYAQPFPAVAVPDSYCLMPIELTAENGSKGLLSGEFFEEVELSCPECDPDEPDADCDICAGEYSCLQKIPVSWTTIKEIYKKAVGSLSAAPTTEKSSTVPSPVVAVPENFVTLLSAIKQYSNGNTISVPDNINTEEQFFDWLKAAESSPRITEQDSDGYVCGDNYEFGLWSRRNIEAFIADGNHVGGVTKQDAREIIILEALSSIESSHFRTVHDHGATEHAQIVLGHLRSMIGLPMVFKKDLPIWDGKKYAMPADSNLIANQPALLAKLNAKRESVGG